MAETYNGQTTGSQEGDIKAGYLVNGAYLKPGDTIVAPSDTSASASSPAPEIKPPGSSGIVGSSAPVKSEYDAMANDIKTGLAQYGINPPDISGAVASSAEAQKIIDDRRAELAKRQAEDVAALNASYATGRENLAMSQADALKQATGEATYGGFLTRMEVEDLQKLERQNRLDMAAYDSQHQATLQQAQRAYEDGDYQLAADKIKEAKDLEAQKYQRQQDYFNNVQQYNQMSTPIKRANQAVQDTITGWLTKYPDAFKDVQPSDLLNMSINDAYNRVINSQSYQNEVSGAGDVLSISDAKALGVPYGTTRKQAMAMGKVPTGESSGGGTFTSTQTNQGAANAGMSIAQFKALDADTKNFYINSWPAQKKALQDDINAGDVTNEELKSQIDGTNFSAEAKQIMKDYVDQNLPAEAQPQDNSAFLPYPGGMWNPVNWFY